MRIFRAREKSKNGHFYHFDKNGLNFQTAHLFFTKFFKNLLKFDKNRQLFSHAKVIFHGREICQFFNFWANLKKQPYIFAFFGFLSWKSQKILIYPEKSEKTGLQQEKPHKNDDFAKIDKKSTFFLKNRFTVVKFRSFFKMIPTLT